jgi:hypothetical protein
MKNKLPHSLLVIVYLTVFSCCRPDGELSLKINTISSFYAVITTSNLMDIPDKKDRDTLIPYISADFHSLLVRGSEAEKKYAASSKEPVPPMIEGSLFVSLFEGADSYGAITPENGNNSFLVELSYGDKPSGKNKMKWKDRVFLIRENKRWVIDDIELLGNWDFGRRGRLKNILREVIKNAGTGIR